MGATIRLDFTTPHALRSDAEYEAAAAAVDELIAEGFPADGSPEADRLDFLSALIMAYDAQHVRFGVDVETTPQEAVEFGLQQHGMTRADLAPIMGGKSRVSEFFAGVRSLSITQVGALRERLGLPADLLIPRVARQIATKPRDAAAKLMAEGRRVRPRTEVRTAAVSVGGKLLAVSQRSPRGKDAQIGVRGSRKAELGVVGVGSKKRSGTAKRGGAPKSAIGTDKRSSPRRKV
jgi:HTH-type transcriptional regulator / antitoxin HigA